MQWVITVRPDLGQVEGVEPVSFGFFEGHNLHLQRPAGVILLIDRLEQVAPVVVCVFAGNPVGLGLSKEVNALVCLEMILHPEALAFSIDPHIGVARITVHVPPAPGNPTVTKQYGNLVRRLGR
jgi:hypothetical protein